MGKSKRQNRSKRSLASLPKGLVHKDAATMNPFEEMSSRQKKPKQLVHNRPVSKPKTTKHTLESLQRRQTQLRSTLKSSKKSNTFVDRRIGQYDPTMSKDDQMLARLVRERSRQSKRQSKFQLDDDGDDTAAFGGGGGGGPQDLLTLTHKGKPLDPNQKVNSRDVNLLSDDEDDDVDRGNLAAVDTELHFGGGRISSQQRNDPYGGGSGAHQTDLSQVYSHRKTELDDLILRRKIQKAERMETKEAQVDKVDQMDDGFAELSALLRYRKNEPPPSKSAPPAKPTQEEIEMNEWQRDMRQIMSKPKRKASDRTKTPEEIAKEQAEKLHELETRRLARMNGDFSDDDFSDISVNAEDSNKKSRKNTKKNKKDQVVKDKRPRNPDELSDSENEEEDDGKLEARFTADGLVYVDKKGRVVKKLGDEELEDEKVEDESSSSEDEDGSDDDSSQDDEDNNTKDEMEEPPRVFHVGDQVRGNFHAHEQFDGREAWYEGVIAKVHSQPDGSQLYDVEYDDGDYEEDMIPKNIRPLEDSAPDEEDKKVTQKELTKEEQVMKHKRQKARDKARHEIPYVFEVPTTLEALHELIAKYASTGEDASLIIQRIHTSNSVRLDRRNGEKMQNYYDVLLRRFVAVGDAIFESGDGGEELGRYRQLDTLTKVMYAMAQDAPETAGAVWSRRLGIFQNAHAKRMRDADFLRVDDDDEEDENFISAWPSTGTFLLLRALGHVFPVTDKRHHVVTPAILLLGQMVAHTPILSLYDVVMGVLCSGLLLEYTKEAKRVAPEALGFLAGVVRLFAPPESGHFPVPSLEAARYLPAFECLREHVISASDTKNESFPGLSMERSEILGENSQAPTSILIAALNMIERTVATFNGAFSLAAEPELFSEVSESLVSLCPMTKEKPFPKAVQRKVSFVASSIAKICPSSRAPLSRRLGPSIQESAVKSLAPRMEDPNKYSMSKDKGKKSVQAAIDRTRREYKREHKAINRELRLDAAFIETERRKEKDKKDSKARAKRQKNFAWLEGEQEAMNQQVRQGGGLLKGGGTGLARAKASTAKMGIKKGGKF